LSTISWDKIQRQPTLMREEFSVNNIFILLSSGFPLKYTANPGAPPRLTDSRITREPAGQTA
jgi:hypothetical protein